MFGNVALVDTAVFARTYDQEQWAHASGVTQSSVGIDPSRPAGTTCTTGTSASRSPPAGRRRSPSSARRCSSTASTRPARTSRRRTSATACSSSPPTPPVTTQPFISFGYHDLWPGSDYNGIDDLAEIWWDLEAEGPDESTERARACTAMRRRRQALPPGRLARLAPAMFEREGFRGPRLDEPPAGRGAVPDPLRSRPVTDTRPRLHHRQRRRRHRGRRRTEGDAVAGAARPPTGGRGAQPPGRGPQGHPPPHAEALFEEGATPTPA